MDPIPAQANIRTADVVARLDGSPIIVGDVYFYVIANTGANAGKWFQTSDDSWQVAEAIAGTMAHKADGHWQVSVDAACWIDGIEYSEYASESTNLHVPVSKDVRCHYPLAIGATGESVDWTNGGRLDLLLDAIKAVTDALPDAGALDDLALILADTNELQTDDIPGLIAALNNLSQAQILSDATPFAGATVNDWTNGGRLDLILDLILGDTGELQTDWADGGRLDLILDAILADTNELQTDDIPGLIAALNNLSQAQILSDATPFAGTAINDWLDAGRLDLLLDAIKAVTDMIPDAGALTALLAQLQLCFDILGGRKNMVANQLIHYKADNVTPVKTFDLLDIGGNPAMTAVTERIVV